VPIILKLLGQFSDQRAVSRVAYHGDVRGNRINRHRRADQDGRRRSANVVGQTNLDSDFGGCAFAPSHKVGDKIHFGESALEPCVQTAADRVVRGEISGEHRPNKSGTIVIEAFSESSVSSEQAIDNALRGILKQISRQSQQEAAVTGEFDVRALGGRKRCAALAQRLFAQ
jgi:hypothetical protein